MTKGGAREKSSPFAIAKGMGIGTFIEVLREISKLDDLVEVETVHANLLFGGERTETCRSYFKELWRYGFVDAFNTAGQKVDFTERNWSSPVKKVYRITDQGRSFLKVPHGLKTLALSPILLEVVAKGRFPQMDLALGSLANETIPLDYFEAADQVGVVRDSIKAILFGWLEPLGFLNRVAGGTKFSLNQEFYSLAKSNTSDKLVSMTNVPFSVSTQEWSIAFPKLLPPIAPEDTGTLTIELEFHGREPLGARGICRINPALWSRTPQHEFEFEIGSTRSISIPIQRSTPSESGIATSIGILEVGESKVRLPNVLLTTRSHLFELKVAKTLGKLGYSPILFTKSDRPDMVLFPSRVENSTEKFLHNPEFKILVEATSEDILPYSKVEADLNNFVPHTTKVLKINAKRTLIVAAGTIAGSVYAAIPSLKKKYHPFTIIRDSELKLALKLLKGNRLTRLQFDTIFCKDGIVERHEVEQAIGAG